MCIYTIRLSLERCTETETGGKRERERVCVCVVAAVVCACTRVVCSERERGGVLLTQSVGRQLFHEVK